MKIVVAPVTAIGMGSVKVRRKQVSSTSSRTKPSLEKKEHFIKPLKKYILNYHCSFAVQIPAQVILEMTLGYSAVARFSQSSVPLNSKRW